MHVVFGHIIHFHRTESSETDMERHIREVYALILNPLQKFLREVQSRCRCCGAAVEFRVNGIIHAGILQLVCNIRRKRHFSEPVQHFFPDSVIVEFHKPVAVVDDVQNFRSQTPVAKGDFCARTKLLAGLYQCFPGIFGSAVQKKNLDIRSGIRLGSKEPCRDNLGVVEHQCLAGFKVINDVMENLRQLSRCIMGSCAISSFGRSK